MPGIGVEAPEMVCFAVLRKDLKTVDIFFDCRVPASLADTGSVLYGIVGLKVGFAQDRLSDDLITADDGSIGERNEGRRVTTETQQPSSTPGRSAIFLSD